MRTKAAIGCAFFLAGAFFPGWLRAQPGMRGFLELNLPYVETSPDGTEKLMSRKLRLEVPTNAMSELERYSHRMDLSKEQSQAIQQQVARIGLDYVVNVHKLSESSASESDKVAKLKELQQQLKEQIDHALDQVLLPHQREVLKKAKLQREIVQFEQSPDGNPDLVSALELTPEQIENLRAKLQENRRQLQVEMRDFINSKRLELFKSVLNEEQMQKLADALKDD